MKFPMSPSAQLSLPGSHDITRVVLSNGMVVLARPNFNSPSVVISGFIDTGSLFDPPAKLGLADFTAMALLHGTALHSFQQIYDALESVGASLNISGGTHTSSFGGKALAEDLDLLLGICADALRQPIFPQDQIERLRARLLTGLAIRAQDTQEMASLTFDQIVYPGHPYSLPADGYPETIQSITQQDLIDFHHLHYGPHGMSIAVVGAVDPILAIDKIEKILGEWTNLAQPVVPALPQLPSPADPRTRKVEIRGKYQSDLIIGAAGPERRSPDFLPAALGNNILGVFGMMGRLGASVREAAGLAYYVYSSVSGGLGPGPWEVSAGVDPANVDRALELIQAEIDRYISQPVTDEELADCQANFIGRLPLSFETNGGVASALLNLERYDLGLDYYRQYPDLIREITQEQILTTAQRYLSPEKLGVAIAGP